MPNFKCLYFTYLTLLLSAFMTPCQAQYASYGSGIGLNILRSDDFNDKSANNTRTISKKYELVGKPRLSLNIDYNFPREIENTIFKRIYNPIFSTGHLQLRGQIIFNQFDISEQKNNSIATWGMSFLYFPKRMDDNKKTNFFIETGYKMGWNNTIVDPFNSMVAGFGTRHRLSNDWYWQTNLTYTVAFYDYLDLTGPKGYAKTSKDGFFLLNFSLLKPFLTKKESKRVDESRDSLAVAENFVTSATLKSTKVIESIKTMQSDLKTLEDKALENEKNTLKTDEIANTILAKINQSYGRLKNRPDRDKVEREMDSLQGIGFSLNLSHAISFEKAQFEFLSKNPLESKLNDMQQEIKEARQNLLMANKFLPRSKDFKFKIQQLEARELGEAKESVEKMLKEWTLIQGKIDKNKVRLKTLLATFEKTTKDVKTTTQELEKIISAINKMNK